MGIQEEFTQSLKETQNVRIERGNEKEIFWEWNLWYLNTVGLENLEWVSWVGMPFIKSKEIWREVYLWKTRLGKDTEDEMY